MNKSTGGPPFIRSLKSLPDWLKTAIYYFLGVALVVIIWEIIHFAASNFVFPEFFLTLGKAFTFIGDSQVMTGLGYSILRIVISISVALVTGYIFGLLASYYSPLEQIFKPLVYILTSIPTASVILFLIIYTTKTCYIIVFLITFPIVYKAVLKGGKEVLNQYSYQLILEGRHSTKNFFKVMVPLTLPNLFMGLAQISGLALKSEVMGEVFMTSNHFIGIGKLIRDAYYNVEMERLFALTLLALMTMGIVDLILYLIQRKIEQVYKVKREKLFRLY